MTTDAPSATRAVFPSTRLMGLSWEGTYAQAAAGAIGVVMRDLRRLLALAPDARILGVSWSDRSDGFRHFCGVEVSAGDAVSEGLDQIEIPARPCLTVAHPGADATRAYAALMAERDRLGLRGCHDPSMIDEHLGDGSMRIWLTVDAE